VGCSSDGSHGSTSKGSGKPSKGDDTTAVDSGPPCDDNALASAKEVCNPGADPCGLNSGFRGDDYCIPPPPEGKGIQIHFGPKNYTDADEIAKYEIQPGEEFNAYGIANIDALADHWYNYTQIRMRPGSHHLINTLVQGDDLTEGYLPAGQGCPGTPLGGFPGTQNLIRNMPPNGVEAPENVGLGSKLPADTKLCLNYHSYNFDSDTPQLREAWINVWFVDESEVTQRAKSVTIFGGPFAGIPPHSQKVLKAETTISGGDGRIINMFGHRHAATDRFAVWKNDALVYDSWHWDESVSYDYDSLTQNPPLNPTAKTDGAVSGMLPITTGDKISIECDVNNTTDNTLTFRNELLTGEMCILFGSSVGVPVGGGLPGQAPPAD
jgi:hypothetical protein